MSFLAHKKVILGVCGSISAYKAALLVRLLVKAKAEVQVVMTTSALTFISPLTLATLSKRPALSEYTGENGTWHNHVELGLWADVMIMAPATANTLSKAANGLCDNLLLATYLSARCPIVWAPAMDLDMMQHFSIQNNLATLQSYGNHIIEAESGELASGLSGKGRLAEPEHIVAWLEDFFKPKDQFLLGKKVLITAGPTLEAIDPVRFISNHSTGKMGVALAIYAKNLGAEVTLVAGPLQVSVPEGITHVKVQSALEMLEEVQNYSAQQDYFIMSAAVADYRVENSAQEKIKRSDSSLRLNLIPNPDIAAWVGAHKLPHQKVIGFALETNNALEYGKAKLQKKQLDFIVINSPSDAGTGFGHDTNAVTLLDAKGNILDVPLRSKDLIAEEIWKFILNPKD